jgi:prepilin-type N-terminal cleavage/methylation domain-containing protein
MKLPSWHRNSRQRGYTIVEMVVVVGIIGTLSLVAAPSYRKALESSRASQAIYFLAHIQSAQERYYAFAGEYAQRVRDLDGLTALPAGFKVAQYKSSNWELDWQLVLQREGPSNGYGKYHLTWTQDGFDLPNSSVPETLLPYRVNRRVSGSAKGQGSKVR